MAFCSNCGSECVTGAKYCPNCGQATAQAAGPQFSSEGQYQQPRQRVYASPEEKDIAENKVFAILSYFFLLVLVPIFAAPKSRFARFHANIGLNIAICEAAVMIIFEVIKAVAFNSWYYILYGFSTGRVVVSVIEWILLIALFVFAVIGIVDAAQGKMRDIPVFSKIKLLK